jgi:hypothetical protein
MMARIISGLFDDGRMYRPVVVAMSAVALDRKHSTLIGTSAPAAGGGPELRIPGAGG